ncbi:MAG: hypothetical protein ABIO05_00850, partial [Ferruginibacter sp.]
MQKKRTAFGITRFGTLVAMLSVFYFFSQLGWAYVTAFSILLAFCFRWLLLKDLANKAAIRHQQILIDINNGELKALAGNYLHFNSGTAYTPGDHPYALDLDILGHASLYQFCNRTASDMGAKQLAESLLAPLDQTEIPAHQQAVKELAADT